MPKSFFLPLVVLCSVASVVQDHRIVERVIFANADPAGRIRRLWIVQFERTLPGHPGSYDAPMGDPVRIGPRTFGQRVGPYSFARSIASKPGGEAEKTKQFLRDRGLHVDDELTMARFEAHPDPQNRSELIIFYWEPGAASAGFAEKAMRTFTIAW